MSKRSKKSCKDAKMDAGGMQKDAGGSGSSLALGLGSGLRTGAAPVAKGTAGTIGTGMAPIGKTPGRGRACDSAHGNSSKSNLGKMPPYRDTLQTRALSPCDQT